MEGLWMASYATLWVFVVVQAVLILVLYRHFGLMYLSTAEGVSRDGLKLGAIAPEFVLPDVNGQQIRFTDYRGRWVLLIFGMTQCEPCRKLIADLNQFVKEYRSTVECLFLVRATPAETKEFVVEYDVRVPVLITENMKLADAYKARVTPFGFLIDPAGLIRSKGLVNNRNHLDLLTRQGLTQEMPSSPALSGKSADSRVA